MKILHVSSFGYEAGGTETGLVELREEQIKRGHIVKVFTTNESGDKAVFADYTYHGWTEIPLLNIPLRIFNPFAYFKLKKVLNEYQPDIVHFHRMDLLSPSVFFLMKSYPAVMTIHGPEDFIKSLLVWFMPFSYFKNKNDISQESLNYKGKLHFFYHVYIQQHVYNLGLKNVDKFIAPSNHFKNLIEKELNPVTTVYNGVHLLKQKKKVKRGHEILFTGRIDKFKGVDYILEAMPEILQAFPDVVFTIVGEGNYKQELINIIKCLKISKNVRFVPWQSSSELEKYYQKANIVIMPSLWLESFGKVGVEAMSTGTPVIASRVGGIPEWLVDGETGFLVEPRNAKQIAEKVNKLFADEKLILSMGVKARKRAEEFSIEKHALNIEKVYEELTNKAR